MWCAAGKGKRHHQTDGQLDFYSESFFQLSLACLCVFSLVNGTEKELLLVYCKDSFFLSFLELPLWHPFFFDPFSVKKIAVFYSLALCWRVCHCRVISCCQYIVMSARHVSLLLTRCNDANNMGLYAFRAKFNPTSFMRMFLLKSIQN